MRKQTFTLVEILVSITIIAILAGMLIGGLNYASKRADTAKTQAILEEFQMALDAFKHDNGYYPPCATATVVQFTLATHPKDSSISDVLTLHLIGNYPFQRVNFTNHSLQKPYIDIQVSSGTVTLYDAWDHPIQYQCPGTHNPQGYDLWSYGPDGNPNTTDDLTNWKQN